MSACERCGNLLVIVGGPSPFAVCLRCMIGTSTPLVVPLLRSTAPRGVRWRDGFGEAVMQASGEIES